MNQLINIATDFWVQQGPRTRERLDEIVEFHAKLYGYENQPETIAALQQEAWDSVVERNWVY